MTRPVDDSARCVGVISDTHGLLRAEAIEALKGVDYVIHAGDIGSPSILSALATIAPVTAVRGNNDREEWAERIAEAEVLKIAGQMLYVLHDLKALDFDPRSRGISAVIAGHSHKPAIVEKEGVVYLNPGSAGPRRFKLPISIGKLYVSRTSIRAEIVPLHLK